MTKSYETPDVGKLRRWLDDMRALATREGVYNGNRAVLSIIACVEPVLDALAEDAENARAEVDRLAGLLAEVKETAEHYYGQANGSAAVLRALGGTA